MSEFIQLHWYEMLMGVIFLYMIYGVARNGGIKNALFGARQKHEIGKVHCRRRFGATSSIVVHVMNDTETGDEIVGLELVHKAFFSYSVQPLTLEKGEALRFAELLTNAGGGAKHYERR